MKRLVNARSRMEIGYWEYLALIQKIRSLKAILDQHRQDITDHMIWLWGDVIIQFSNTEFQQRQSPEI